MLTSLRRLLRPAPASPRRLVTFRPELDRLEDRRVPAVGGVGPAFRVNTFTEGNQVQSDNASNSSGWRVATWVRTFSSTNQSIRAQIYNAQNQRVGREIIVTGSTAAKRTDPAVAVDGYGNFTIVWKENNAVKGQRFSAYGRAKGAAFLVAPANTNPQRREHGYIAPDIAADGPGSFVVTVGDLWHNGQVVNGSLYARLYRADGALFRTILVASGGGDYNLPVRTSVGRTLNGTFTIGYITQSLGGSGFDYYVNARQYTGTGGFLREPINGRGDFYLGQGPYRAAIATTMDNHGNAAVVYQAFRGIQAATISDTGVASAPFQIVAAGTFNDAVMDRDNGHIVVAWTGRTAQFQPTMNLTEHAPSGEDSFGTISLGPTKYDGALSAGRGHTFILTYTNDALGTNRNTQIYGHFGTFSS